MNVYHGGIKLYAFVGGCSALSKSFSLLHPLAQGVDSVGAILDARRKGTGPEKPPSQNHGEASGWTSSTAMKQNGPTSARVRGFRWRSTPDGDAIVPAAAQRDCGSE